MKKYLLATLFAILSFTTNAQLVRSYSNEFLNIGVSARAMGMSKSVSSFVTGVESGYWNPAGIVTVQDYEFAGMHNSLYAGIANYDYFAVALPIERDEIAFGVSFVRLGVENILNTTSLIDNNGNVDYNNISSFTSADVAAILSVAKSFPKLNLNVGINGKIIRRNIGNFAIGHGFGFDIGAQYKLNDKINIGLTLRDITTTFTAWNVKDAIFNDISEAQTQEDGQNQERPDKYELTLPKFQLGISYVKQFNANYKLLSSIDLIGRFIETNDIVSSSFVSFSPQIGFELSYIDRVYLRAGAGNFQNELDFDNQESLTIEPSLGIGIRFNLLHIDYALTNVGDASGLGYSNVFSIKVQLNEIR
ncbi:putative type IX sorting system protein PorV2 [Wenyingzhuangia sp. IMCC45574]